MTVRLPSDIEALVEARVTSGEFSNAEAVLREAMEPWLARERLRQSALDQIRAKIADGDADPVDLTPEHVRQHLDAVAASLPRLGPDAA